MYEKASSVRKQMSLAFFALLLVGANDGAIGILIPTLSTHYHLDNARVGLLFPFEALGFLITAFLNGFLMSRLGVRRYLLLGASIFLISTMILGLMPPFFIVLLVLLLLGCGAASLDVGLNTYIAQLPGNVALLNYLHAMWGVGALLGPLIASTLLLSGRGWNDVYLVWGTMSLVLLVGFAWFFHGSNAYERGERAQAGENGAVLRATLKLRIVWVITLFYLVYVGVEISLGSWSYSFLIDARHGSAWLMSWVVSGYWFGLTAARLTLARVTQRLGEKRVIQVALLVVILSLLLIWLIPQAAIAAVGFCLIGYSLGPVSAATVSSLSRRVSSPLLPSAIGFLFSLGDLGTAFFPWLAGNVIQLSGLWSLLPYEIGLTLILLCLWTAFQTHTAKELREGSSNI